MQLNKDKIKGFLYSLSATLAVGLFIGFVAAPEIGKGFSPKHVDNAGFILLIISVVLVFLLFVGNLWAYFYYAQYNKPRAKGILFSFTLQILFLFLKMKHVL